MKKLLFTLTIFAFGIGLAACGSKPAANNAAPANANAAKPANASNAAPSNAATGKKEDKPKPKLTDEKKPTEGKAKTAKNVPVPDSWIYVYDENKGYGFSLPEGSTGASETMEGIDVFVATTPAPAEIGIFVLAYKDKTRSKEDLLNDAVKFLEGMGETVTAGKLTGESEDYSVAEASMTSKEGKNSKAKILVGTDVTDNYVMILGTDEEKYAANEKVIDEIWGSFEMWSGGASGNN